MWGFAEHAIFQPQFLPLSVEGTISAPLLKAMLYSFHTRLWKFVTLLNILGYADTGTSPTEPWVLVIREYKVESGHPPTINQGVIMSLNLTVKK